MECGNAVFQQQFLEDAGAGKRNQSRTSHRSHRLGLRYGVWVEHLRRTRISLIAFHLDASMRTMANLM